jgi:hypothetical protein
MGEIVWPEGQSVLLLQKRVIFCKSPGFAPLE